jgi:hypothetical protein
MTSKPKFDPDRLREQSAHKAAKDLGKKIEAVSAAKMILLPAVQLFTRLSIADNRASHEAASHQLDIIRDLVADDPNFRDAVVELWFDGLTIS